MFLKKNWDSLIGVIGLVLGMALLLTHRTLAAALVILAVLIFGQIISWQHIKNARRKYWAKKKQISDADFLAVFEPYTSEQAKFCLAVRKKIAKAANVSEQSVNSTDSFSEYGYLDYQEPSIAGTKQIIKGLGLDIKADFCWVHELYSMEILADFLNYIIRNWNKIVAVRSSR